MQIQSKNNYSQVNNTNFGALKKVYCGWSNNHNYDYECHKLEKKIIKELRDLAEKDNFFKNNDVTARVNSHRVTLKSKPTQKNIFDKVKNLFIRPKYYMVEDNHLCPDDSSYFIARKLRNIRDGKERFSDVFIKG